eukprot:4774067-Amphidinium_carterae.1
MIKFLIVLYGCPCIYGIFSNLLSLVGGRAREGRLLGGRLFLSDKPQQYLRCTHASMFARCCVVLLGQSRLVQDARAKLVEFKSRQLAKTRAVLSRLAFGSNHLTPIS